MDLTKVASIDPDYQVLLIEGFKSVEEQWQEEAMALIRKALLCGKPQDKLLSILRKFRTTKRKEAQERWIFENPEAYDEAMERERKKSSRYIDDEVSYSSGNDDDDDDFESEVSGTSPTTKRQKHSDDEQSAEKKAKKSKKSKKSKKDKKDKKKKKKNKEADEEPLED
eukprot:TRINITY_DN16881_c0_g1_i1.p1 TRINITY_DN16881_c0_g1~~TRINITY_DN16881_c0_g1_i1.p1  ORF type:complete len:168 (+),score=53.87 TRINITY_DN16881_c0_g1_i1:68-571(+)